MLGFFEVWDNLVFCFQYLLTFIQIPCDPNIARSKLCTIQIVHDPNFVWSTYGTIQTLYELNFARSKFCMIQILHDPNTLHDPIVWFSLSYDFIIYDPFKNQNVLSEILILRCPFSHGYVKAPELFTHAASYSLVNSW